MTVIMPKKPGLVAPAPAVKHNYTESDEFATRRVVNEQLQELATYIEARRAEDPDYGLPYPTGWRMAILMLTLPEVSEGGFMHGTFDRQARALQSPQGIVLAMGKACYTDKERFAVDGEIDRWCEVGDRITWIKYDAAMYHLANGQQIGFMNDTHPVGVIDRNWKVPA